MPADVCMSRSAYAELKRIADKAEEMFQRVQDANARVCDRIAEAERDRNTTIATMHASQEAFNEICAQRDRIRYDCEKVERDRDDWKQKAEAWESKYTALRLYREAVSKRDAEVSDKLSCGHPRAAVVEGETPYCAICGWQERVARLEARVMDLERANTLRVR